MESINLLKQLKVILHGYLGKNLNT
jgi:hypothetical protein